jgi:outer membrane protein assembly factor BamD (BamD/ComL family)
MKAFKAIALLILAGTILLSCSDPRNDDIEKITQMENDLFSEESSLDNMDKAKGLIDEYTLFADQYPEDTLSPEFLFRAADIAMNINRGEMAINIYNRILKSYPDFRKAPECLFLKAYVYENNLGQLNKARVYYQEFIDKYPENDFADDAEISIQNLGKSPEELIREFEEKMKAQEEVQ